MKQQTAVEHFLQILQVNFPNETYDMFGNNKSLLLESLEQAKQIEKKQIIKAHGDRYDREVDEIISGEQYYYINYVYQGTDDTTSNKE